MHCLQLPLIILAVISMAILTNLKLNKNYSFKIISTLVPIPDTMPCVLSEINIAGINAHEIQRDRCHAHIISIVSVYAVCEIAQLRLYVISIIIIRFILLTRSRRTAYKAILKTQRNVMNRSEDVEMSICVYQPHKRASLAILRVLC